MSRFLPAAVVAVVLFALSAPAMAQDDEITIDVDPRPILAVYDIQVEGVSLTEKKIAALTEYLRTRLTIEKYYRVVPGEATTRALVEVKAESQGDHCDDSCKIALGQKLAAAKVVETRVEKVGSRCSVSARIFDVGQEIADMAAETDKQVECTETGIRGGLKVVAAMLRDRGAVGPVPDGAAPAPRPVVTDTGRVVDMSEIDTGEDIVNIETGQVGIVVIDSNPPGASLLVNGVDQGVAKKSIQLNVGRYVIVARLDDYYHVARSEVTVEPNKVKRITMDLAPAFGVLDVSCTPDGAEVYIDGRFAGQCPLHNPRMKSGTYRVEVRRGLYETVTRQVVVRDGATASERFDLPAAWGKLEINSTPRGADVWFDGRQIGVTPMTTDMMPTGRYKVRVVMPLFEPVQFDVDLAGGRTVRKDLSMVADFGSVSVNTTPSGATVTVDDGADTCYRTPCSFPRMGTGLHALTIEKDGYAREAKNVDVTRGGQQAVNVTLREKLGTLTVFAKYTDGTDCEGDIYIDGQRQPEPTPFMGQVLATSHLVEVRCPGAAPVSENITVEHNRTVTRTISTCQPECSGKNCGPDGCGGDCGTCRSGTRCLDGLCRQIAPAPRPQPVETRPAAPATRPQTIGSGSGGTSGQSGRAQGGKTGGSGLTLTWETLGVGYLGSINQLWNAVTVTPVELGFKAFKGLLFAGFLDWQILIPWSGISAGFLNALHIGARLGYEFLNIGDNTFAMFADAKLAWEYNFSFGDDQTDAFGTHAMLAGARVGLRITFVKLAVTFDYSTLNGAGAGFSFSIGN